MLANLVTNGAAECTQAQRIILWILIALFCITSHVLSFTDSFELNGTRHTVLLFTGFLVPSRLYRRIMCWGELTPEDTALLEEYEADIEDLESFDPHTAGSKPILVGVSSGRVLNTVSLPTPPSAATPTLLGASSSRSFLTAPVREASFARASQSTSFKSGAAGRKSSFQAPPFASTVQVAALDLTPVPQSPEGSADPPAKDSIDLGPRAPEQDRSDPVLPLDQGGPTPAGGQPSAAPQEGADKPVRRRLTARKKKPFIPYTPTSLSTKVVFLPDVPHDPDNPDAYLKFYHYYELGPGQLTIQDFLTAWLTLGTFFTLAVLTNAYVSCTFPNYDPNMVQAFGMPLLPAL